MGQTGVVSYEQIKDRKSEEFQRQAPRQAPRICPDGAIATGADSCIWASLRVEFGKPTSADADVWARMPFSFAHRFDLRSFGTHGSSHDTQDQTRYARSKMLW